MLHMSLKKGDSMKIILWSYFKYRSSKKAIPEYQLKKKKKLAQKNL